jgi:pimeloyl-ACP methyl ester carboxylesterase
MLEEYGKNLHFKSLHRIFFYSKEEQMQVNNLEFNVQVSGEGETFVWGHGLSASIEAEDLLDWFQWHRFPDSIKLVRYDARGHGKSELSKKPEDYHWRNLAKDMLAVADGVGAKKFIAGGSSMGCATAICAAIEAPERMKAMVLVIPPTAWETRAAQGAIWNRFALFGRLLGGKGMGKMMGKNIDRMLPQWLIDAEPERMEGVFQGMAAQKSSALWNIFKGAGLTDLPPREEFRALVDIPCQILAWVGDPTHPVSSAEEVHRLLPKSELFIAQGYEDFKTIPQRMRDFVVKVT